MNKATQELANTIKSNLLQHPAWVERAILALYARQTCDEQASLDTKHSNSQGFTSADARRFSFVAQFIQKGGHLTREKALGVYAVRLQKYAGQLALIAQAKKAATKAPGSPQSATKTVQGPVVATSAANAYGRHPRNTQPCMDSEYHDGEECTCYSNRY